MPEENRFDRGERLARIAACVDAWDKCYLDVVVGPTECYVWGECTESGKEFMLLDTKGDMDALERALTAMARPVAKKFHPGVFCRAEVVSEPGAAIKLTALELTPEAQQGLSTGGARIPRQP